MIAHCEQLAGKVEMVSQAIENLPEGVFIQTEAVDR
jgi:hypothetical protein